MLRALKSIALYGALASLLMASECALGQGLPRDWSNRHFLYQHGRDEQFDATRDPRRFVDWLNRIPIRHRPTPPGRMPSIAAQRVDWNVSLGGGTLADGVFPAKYSAGLNESCTADWVVYGTNNSGASGTPNVVAYSNLYPSPTCPGTGPTLKFAYYVPGAITTSPVISLDGTKIAFVEGGTNAKFHVVSTSLGGALGKATQVQDAAITLGAADTQSSPFVDYANDIAYVGTDDGNLHKITGVFTGTPSQVVVANHWPTQVSNISAYGNFALLTSPVLYTPAGSTYGIVLVAGNYLVSTNPVNGYETLFAVDANTGTVYNSGIKVAAISVSDAPLLDVTNNVAYLFSGNSNPTYGDSSPAAVEQIVLEYSSGTFSFGAVTPANLGSTPTPSVLYNSTYNIYHNPIHSGTFDYNWFTSPSGTGYLVACGTGATAAPTLYSFAVNKGTVTTPATPTGYTSISTNTADVCSPLTEAYDTVNTVDRFYVGTPLSGVECGSTTTGCIQDFTLSSGSPKPSLGTAEANGTSGIVVDGNTGTSTYIYFTTLSAAGNGTTKNPAIQLSQQGLN